MRERIEKINKRKLMKLRTKEKLWKSENYKIKFPYKSSAKSFKAFQLIENHIANWTVSEISCLKYCDKNFFNFLL